MTKIFAIARWEFIEKIKTKAFIISLIITPLILIGFTVGGTLLSGKDESTKAIGFLDPSGIYINSFREQIENINLSNGQPAYIFINLFEKNKTIKELRKKADEAALNNRISGYLLISNASTDSVTAEFRTTASVNLYDTRRFEKALNDVRIVTELKKYGITEDIAGIISKEVNIEHVTLNDKGEERHSDFLVTFFSSIIFIMMLMTVVLTTGGMLVRSLIEEKSNRLIDILVSSCTSQELLTGKILGLSSLGLFQILIWFIISFSIAGYASIPEQTFDNFYLIMLYFIFGFFFYTAIFVGLGSVAATEQESQQITGYLSMVLVFPVVLALPAIENPDSMLLHVLSYIPFTLPTVMMLRLNLSPVPLQDILLTLLVLISSILLTIRISAKIFRVGILSYGKMPSVKELRNWIRSDE